MADDSTACGVGMWKLAWRESSAPPLGGGQCASVGADLAVVGLEGGGGERLEAQLQQLQGILLGGPVGQVKGGPVGERRIQKWGGGYT
jgi:hypothetical protein